ncbi:hypothetical protein ACFC26_16020 [Kitasatospora purpeofusca]|uniref:hypothetical protein n=1 Tax=Kitasatospora purpeofusca TaxID=67352 RepID=UPI0035D79D7A
MTDDDEWDLVDLFANDADYDLTHKPARRLWWRRPWPVYRHPTLTTPDLPDIDTYQPS